MIFKKNYILLLILLISTATLYSQNADNEPNLQLAKKNPEGTEFYLTFMRNFNDPDPGKENASDKLFLELFITSDFNANVIIEINSIGFYEQVTVPKGSVRNVIIDSRAQIYSNEIIERDAAVHITSDNPITVYGLNRRKQTTDTYLGLPNSVLGTEYRIISYNRSEQLLPEFAVVAIEDSTVVQIIPRVETQAGRLPGVPFSVVLNQGDVYQVTAKYKPLSVLKNDLSGSLVTANKKIGVFSGHQCAYVPDRIIACNHLVEQVPPIPSWGKHFFIGKLKKRSQYTYRVLANENNTRIFRDAQHVATLNEGEFLEDNSSNALQITADKPVLISQYSQGFKNGDSIGDPMMLLISPTQQFLKKYRFATPVNGFWEHYVNVVVPTNSIKTVKLNGKNIDPNLFEQLGLSRYSIAYIQIPFGTHVLEGSEPFGMYSYGFGYDKNPFDAYGTIGGQSFLEYEPAPDTIPPQAEIDQVEELQLDIIVRDDGIDDKGIQSIKVVSSMGLSTNIPEIIPGSPQAKITVIKNAIEQDSYLRFTATDVAGNIADYTICYYFDRQYKKYIFSLNEGHDISCSSELGYLFGVYGKMNYLMHSPDFGSTGNFTGFGEFQPTDAFGGYAGFYFGKPINEDLVLTAKLAIENYPGTINQPDTLGRNMRNTNDPEELIPFRESNNISLEGTFVKLTLGAEYFLHKYIYAAGGLHITTALSKEVTATRRIVQPQNQGYTGDKLVPGTDGREKYLDISELESLNTFRIGLMGGVGVSVPFYSKFMAFAESNYSYYFNGMIDDGDWDINMFSLLIGLKVRF